MEVLGEIASQIDIALEDVYDYFARVDNGGMVSDDHFGTSEGRAIRTMGDSVIGPTGAVSDITNDWGRVSPSHAMPRVAEHAFLARTRANYDGGFDRQWEPPQSVVPAHSSHPRSNNDLVNGDNGELRMMEPRPLEDMPLQVGTPEYSTKAIGHVSGTASPIPPITTSLRLGSREFVDTGEGLSEPSRIPSPHPDPYQPTYRPPTPSGPESEPSNVILAKPTGEVNLVRGEGIENSTVSSKGQGSRAGPATSGAPGCAHTFTLATAALWSPPTPMVENGVVTPLRRPFVAGMQVRPAPAGNYHDEAKEFVKESNGKPANTIDDEAEDKSSKELGFTRSRRIYFTPIVTEGPMRIDDITGVVGRPTASEEQAPIEKVPLKHIKLVDNKDASCIVEELIGTPQTEALIEESSLKAKSICRKQDCIDPKIEDDTLAQGKPNGRLFQPIKEESNKPNPRRRDKPSVVQHDIATRTEESQEAELELFEEDALLEAQKELPKQAQVLTSVDKDANYVESLNKPEEFVIMQEKATFGGSIPAEQPENAEIPTSEERVASELIAMNNRLLPAAENRLISALTVGKEPTFVTPPVPETTPIEERAPIEEPAGVKETALSEAPSAFHYLTHAIGTAEAEDTTSMKGLALTQTTEDQNFCEASAKFGPLPSDARVVVETPVTSGQQPHADTVTDEAPVNEVISNQQTVFDENPAIELRGFHASDPFSRSKKPQAVLATQTAEAPGTVMSGADCNPAKPAIAEEDPSLDEAQESIETTEIIESTKEPLVAAKDLANASGIMVAEVEARKITKKEVENSDVDEASAAAAGSDKPVPTVVLNTDYVAEFHLISEDSRRHDDYDNEMKLSDGLEVRTKPEYRVTSDDEAEEGLSENGFDGKV